jgi:hypothetical protein
MLYFARISCYFLFKKSKTGTVNILKPSMSLLKKTAKRVIFHKFAIDFQSIVMVKKSKNDFLKKTHQ